MFLLDAEQKKYEKSLSITPLDSRIHIVLYHATDNSVYPINKLRNLAIENVQTSHFWLADMDMWPSCILYSLFSYSGIAGSTYGSSHRSARKR